MFQVRAKSTQLLHKPMTNEIRPQFPSPLADDATPADVASCNDIPKARRLEILRSWREDELAQLRAQSEGMEAEQPETTPTHDSSALVAAIEAQIDRLEEG